MTPLKYHRIKAGMTQEQLAVTAGIKLTTLQKIERGVSDIAGVRLSTALGLANALGIKVDELLHAPETPEE